MIFDGLNLYTGRHVSIETRNGLVFRVDEPGALPEGMHLPMLSRGFVDIQVNGYRGFDYSGDRLTKEGIVCLINDLARAGTLRHMPTVITGSHARTEENLKSIRKAVESDPVIKAAIAGIHLEGPYISGADGARGAHSLQYVRDPDIDELRRWQEAAGGLIRLITLAPERKEAIPFIKSAVGMGISVAIGHSLATEEEIMQAAQAGATLSTHLGNGSPALLPRLKNHIWAQLANDWLHASVIADGFHVPYSTLKVFARAKGFDKLILTSDAGPMGGLAPGRYRWGETDVDVYNDGHLGLAGTQYLAGAGHLLDRAVPALHKAGGCTLRQAIAMVTDNPVRLLRLDGYAGDFVVGEPADILCFEQKNERINVLSYARDIREEYFGDIS